jgi:hypothetical protein
MTARVLPFARPSSSSSSSKRAKPAKRRRRPTGNDRTTPLEVLEVIRAYRAIDLDPCSNPWSLVGARVELSLHRGDNGLEARWDLLAGEDGWVYLNPSYGPGELARWMAKIAAEASAAPELEMMAIVPLSLETRWSAIALDSCDAWGPWRSRIAWGNGDPSVNQGGAKQPSSAWYWGPRRFRWADHFEPHLADVHVRQRARLPEVVIMAAKKTKSANGTAHAYHGELHDYETGKRIRLATASEHRLSAEAKKQSGGKGVILVGERKCYVKAPAKKSAAKKRSGR